MTEDKLRWSWWAANEAEHEPEIYNVNEATRESVIEAARREYGDDVAFTIIEATQDGDFNCSIFEQLYERVIAAFVENNGERFGEDGFEGDIDEDALIGHLDKALAEFIGRHFDDIRTFSFTKTRNKEVIRPEVAAA